MRAETGHTPAAGAGPVLTAVLRQALLQGKSPGSRNAAVGACWTITWALVPLIPNEDTAAVRG